MLVQQGFWWAALVAQVKTSRRWPGMGFYSGVDKVFLWFCGALFRVSAGNLFDLLQKTAI